MTRGRVGVGVGGTDWANVVNTGKIAMTILSRILYFIKTSLGENRPSGKKELK